MLTKRQHFAQELSPDPPEASPNKRPAACHPSNNTHGYLGSLLLGKYQAMSLQAGSRQNITLYAWSRTNLSRSMLPLNPACKYSMVLLLWMMFLIFYLFNFSDILTTSLCCICKVFSHVSHHNLVLKMKIKSWLFKIHSTNAWDTFGGIRMHILCRTPFQCVLHIFFSFTGFFNLQIAIKPSAFEKICEYTVSGKCKVLSVNVYQGSEWAVMPSHFTFFTQSFFSFSTSLIWNVSNPIVFMSQ